MNLQLVIDRLRAQCPGFRLVGGAAELGAAVQSAAVAPACYVIPQTERAGEPEDLDATFQIVEIEFAVVIVSRLARQGAGQEAVADIETLRAAVRAALFGWWPDGMQSPVEFAAGSLIDFKPGELWWQDAWRTSLAIEAV